MPLMKADLVGDEMARLIFLIAFFSQSFVLLYTMMGFAWVDGIFFGTSLVLYSLLTLVSFSIGYRCAFLIL